MLFVDLLKDEVERQHWLCYAWCLMDNHYHLLIETPEANLVRGMHRLNGRYTQKFNHRHEHVGHVFQGRYKSIVVQKERYLMALLRYIVMNPVRAGVVVQADAWPWSSYRYTVAGGASGRWMAREQLLALFALSQGEAVERYVRFINEGPCEDHPWEALQGQIYLGDECFLARIESLADGLPEPHDVPQSQLHPLRPTVEQVLQDVGGVFSIDAADVLDRKANRQPFRVAVYLLYRACNLPLKEVAALADVSAAWVSRIEARMQLADMPALLTKKYKVKT